MGLLSSAPRFPERGVEGPSSDPVFRPRARVLVYQRTTNIGDAIQAVAMARLLGEPCVGVYRDAPAPNLYKEVPFVVNGWLGNSPPTDAGRCLFAGVHLGNAEQEHLRWFRQSEQPVGARDSYTKGLLSCHQVDSEMIGCATLTLPRYRGPRRGRYSIDVDPLPGTQFESSLIPDLSWAEQWDLALFRLEQLRKAEVVYSGRIHAILPCLAFGTPVIFPSSAFRELFDKSRLTILHDLGFVHDEPVEMDVSSLAERFIGFLEHALNTPIQPVDEPRMPIPIMSPSGETVVNVQPVAGERPWRSWDIPQPATHTPPSVSALVMTRNGAKRLARCLESIQRADFARRIIVCVDETTVDESVDVARHYTPHVHFVQSGHPEMVMSRLMSLCPDEFVLRVDDDEQLGGNWDRKAFEFLAEFNPITHFWVPRRWVAPTGDLFIADQPCFPDLQMRLFRNDRRIVSFPNEAHKHLTVAGPSLTLYDRWIEHYALALRSRAERKLQCGRCGDAGRDHDLSYYLYEDKNFTLAPLVASAAMVARLASLSIPRSRRFVAYQPGAAIDFRARGDATHYALEGWSEPEAWGSWTLGADAEIRLLLEEPMPQGATLIARVLPLIHPSHPVSRVEVFYRGELLDEWSFDLADATERRTSVPARLLERDRTPTFIFRTLNPASFHELNGSDDERLLGVGFISLQLMPRLL